MTAGSVSAPLIIPIIDLHTHRTKNQIHTHTPVSMHSDTAGVEILFTVDGSKPLLVQRGSGGGTRKYNAPIRLHAGKVEVRAVAVTSDGRQSSIVTKVFSVEQNNKKENEGNHGDQQPLSEGTSSSTEKPLSSSLKPSGPRFLSSRLDVPPSSLNGPIRRQNVSTSLEPSAVTQSQAVTSRIQRDATSLRCTRCQSVRPSDPFARFCPQCGADLPPERLKPPGGGGQMVFCVFCNNEVPVNTRSCLICEASIQRQPQALQLQVVGKSAPSGRRPSCSKCKRINRADSRFCDWCGSKAVSCVLCLRCGASGDPSAVHCSTCGVLLEAPPTSCCDVTHPDRGVANDKVSTPTSHDALRSSGHAPIRKSAPLTTENYTQTVGLYFPSATGLQRKEKELQTATRPRTPLLTAISPGRGYWRKQLDHVCAHLRSYAQNNAPFRAVLGEPRLGRMVSAVVQEDQYEVSLTVSFVSAANQHKQFQVSPAGGSSVPESLSSVTERVTDSNSLRSERSTAVLKKPNRMPKPPVNDLQLLKELGPGRGDVTIVQQLLDQGADPSCCDGDGRHALAVAVVNGHHDSLPVLVQRGADVDQQSGRLRNSALHDAAALGAKGLKCAQTLLSLRASCRRSNALGHTAYDTAVTSPDGDDIISLLAARTGRQLLGRLGKPRTNLHTL